MSFDTCSIIKHKFSSYKVYFSFIYIYGFGFSCDKIQRSWDIGIVFKSMVAATVVKISWKFLFDLTTNWISFLCILWPHLIYIWLAIRVFRGILMKSNSATVLPRSIVPRFIANLAYRQNSRRSGFPPLKIPCYTAKLSYRHPPQVFKHKSRKTNLNSPVSTAHIYLLTVVYWSVIMECQNWSGITLSVAICDFFSWLATEIGFWRFFWHLDFLV